MSTIAFEEHIKSAQQEIANANLAAAEEILAKLHAFAADTTADTSMLEELGRTLTMKRILYNLARDDAQHAEQRGDIASALDRLQAALSVDQSDPALQQEISRLQLAQGQQGYREALHASFAVPTHPKWPPPPNMQLLDAQESGTALNTGYQALTELRKSAEQLEQTLQSWQEWHQADALHSQTSQELEKLLSDHTAMAKTQSSSFDGPALAQDAQPFIDHFRQQVDLLPQTTNTDNNVAAIPQRLELLGSWLSKLEQSPLSQAARKSFAYKATRDELDTLRSMLAKEWENRLREIAQKAVSERRALINTACELLSPAATLLQLRDRLELACGHTARPVNVDLDAAVSELLTNPNSALLRFARTGNTALTRQRIYRAFDVPALSRLSIAVFASIIGVVSCIGLFIWNGSILKPPTTITLVNTITVTTTSEKQTSQALASTTPGISQTKAAPATQTQTLSQLTSTVNNNNSTPEPVTQVVSSFPSSTVTKLAPTTTPTAAPTAAPTATPTAAPTFTPVPPELPTKAPTRAPTKVQPTKTPPPTAKPRISLAVQKKDHDPNRTGCISIRIILKQPRSVSPQGWLFKVEGSNDIGKFSDSGDAAICKISIREGKFSITASNATIINGNGIPFIGGDIFVAYQQ